MRPSLRILAAVLVLTALMPSGWGRPSVICVEASGRISYGCNDLVPDEVNAHLAVPITLGECSQECGFCHDYTVGQVVTQSFRTLALPVAAIVVGRLFLPQRVFAFEDHPSALAIVDRSGNPLPLKC